MNYKNPSAAALLLVLALVVFVLVAAGVNVGSLTLVRELAIGLALWVGAVLVG